MTFIATTQNEALALSLTTSVLSTLQYFLIGILVVGLFYFLQRVVTPFFDFPIELNYKTICNKALCGCQTEAVTSQYLAINEEYFKDDANRCGSFSLLICRLLPDLFFWPKFYSLLFLVLPCAIGSGSYFALAEQKGKDDENYNWLLFSTQNASMTQDISLLSQLATSFLWVAVYFFALLPVANFFSIAQVLIYQHSQSWIYSKLPISFHKRLHAQFGAFGVLSLVIGVVLSVIETEEALLVGNVTHLEMDHVSSSLSNLVLALAITPWLFLIKHGYKGVKALFAFCIIDIIPGIKLFWWLAHVCCGITCLLCIGLTNPVALYILSFSYSLFYVIPVLWYLWGVSPGRSFRNIRRRSPSRSVFIADSETTFKVFDFELIPGDKLISCDPGIQICILSPRIFGFVFQGVISNHLTEQSRIINFKRLYVNEELGFHLNRIIPDDHVFQNICFSVFMLLNCFCSLYLGLCCLFSFCFPPFLKKLDEEKTEDVYIAPLKGISFCFLYHEQSESSTVVFVVDATGFNTAAVYLEKAIEHLQNPTGMKKRFVFIWVCKSLYDLIAVETILSEVESSSRLATLKFVLLVRIKNPEFINLALQNTLIFTDIVQHPVDIFNQTIDKLNLRRLLVSLDSEMVGKATVVSLGSSWLAYQARHSAVKARKGSLNVSYGYESIIEPSYFSEPVLDMNIMTD